MTLSVCSLCLICIEDVFEKCHNSWAIASNPRASCYSCCASSVCAQPHVFLSGFQFPGPVLHCLGQNGSPTSPFSLLVLPSFFFVSSFLPSLYLPLLPLFSHHCPNPRKLRQSLLIRFRWLSSILARFGERRWANFAEA